MLHSCYQIQIEATLAPFTAHKTKYSSQGPSIEKNVVRRLYIATPPRFFNNYNTLSQKT